MDVGTGLNKTFFIKEYPHITEIMSNSMQGLIESIYYLKDNNYELDFQPCRIIGIQNYLFAHKIDKESEKEGMSEDLIPIVKKQQNQEIIELTFELEGLREESQDFDDIIEDKDLDISKLIDEIKDYKKEIKTLKSQNTKLKNPKNIKKAKKSKKKVK